jgi:hypothetical protein
MHIKLAHRRLFETPSFFMNPEQRDERQIHSWPAYIATFHVSEDAAALISVRRGGCARDRDRDKKYPFPGNRWRPGQNESIALRHVTADH